MTFLSEQQIFPIAAVPSAAFTASSTTQLLTSSAHGLTVNESVILSTSGGLPGGLAATTVYYVINPTTNTFQLSLTQGGSAVVLTTNGTPTNTFTVIGKKIGVKGTQFVELGAFTANNFNGTVKVQISHQSDVNFALAASSTNRWSYAQITDLLANAAVAGVTGITSSGTDIAKNYELIGNARYWISAQITSYTAGNINLFATCFNVCQ